MQQREFTVSDPTAFALATMGRTAMDAAHTWTVQEWAGKLAAQAGPRDYVGQLQRLYNDIRNRWRYVQEQGERVPGTAHALLGHVLGAAYNGGPTCESPVHCDVLRTPWKQRGFGDCDDVATVVAAGALAMGMRPFFRVARWPGGAHVSTMVETPKGERINLDLVGEPEHGFGWALNPHGGGAVELVPVDGNQGAPSMYGVQHGTTLSGLPVHRRRGAEYFDEGHYVLTRPGDNRGPRVLGVPTWHANLMRRGYVEDGMQGVDQFGDVYEYSRGADVWVPMGCVTPTPMGRWRLFGGRTRIGRRLRKIGRRIRKAAAKVLHAVRKFPLVRVMQKAKAALLKSKLVQEVAARALQAFGVPPAATKAVLQREASIARQGGRLAMAEAIASGRLRDAAHIAISSTKEGMRRGLQALVKPIGSVAYVSAPFDAMRGWEDDPHEMELLAEDGVAYPVAPVAGIEAVPGWWNLGQLDIPEAPTLGRWYRVKKGDTFFGVVKAAMVSHGDNPSKQDVTKQAQLINAIPYNQRFWTNAPQGELGFWKKRISFSPKFTCEPENQALNPKTGGHGNCYAVIYLSATGEDPPPFEQPIPPPVEPPPVPEPVEPEPPSVVVPPEEPPTPEPVPELPCPPGAIRDASGACVIVEPPPPVQPPKTEPIPPPPEPPHPEPPAEPLPCAAGMYRPTTDSPCIPIPVAPPPVQPPAPPQLLPCPPGTMRVGDSVNCQPIICRDGFELDASGQCVPMAPPPVVEPTEPIPEPEPLPPPVEPQAPVQPTGPRPSGGFPWMLVALVGGAAVGVPTPMLAAVGLLATSEKRAS